MLPVRPTVEVVVAPVPSVVTELVTLDWLSRMTEPALPDDVFDETVRPSRDVIWPDETVLPSRDVIVPAETVLPSRETIVLEVPSDITLWATTLVQKTNAANVTRCFITNPPMLWLCTHTSIERASSGGTKPSSSKYMTRYGPGDHLGCRNAAPERGSRSALNGLRSTVCVLPSTMSSANASQSPVH